MNNIFYFVICLGSLISFSTSIKIRINSQISLQQPSNVTAVQPIPTPPSPEVEESFKELSVYISTSFWTDKNGIFSRETIAIRTMDDNYLSCSSDNILSADSKQITENSLWRPIKIRDTIIALRSYNGNFLGLRDQIFTCDFNNLTINNYFEVIKSPLEGRAANRTSEILSTRGVISSNITTPTSSESYEERGTTGLGERGYTENTLAFKINMFQIGIFRK